MLMDNFVGHFEKDGNKRTHAHSSGAAFAIEVTNRLEISDRSVRKSVSKLLNEGLFVKNPSPATAATLTRNEQLFDMDSSNLDGAIRIDHNAVCLVKGPHSPEFTLIPMIRYMMNAPTVDPTSPPSFQYSWWWEDQIIAPPVTTQ